MNESAVRKARTYIETSLLKLKHLMPDLSTFQKYEHEVGHKLIFALQALDPCPVCEGQNPHYKCDACHGWKIRGGLDFDPFNVDHIVSKPGSLIRVSPSNDKAGQMPDFDGDVFTLVDLSIHDPRYFMDSAEVQDKAHLEEVLSDKFNKAGIPEEYREAEYKRILEAIPHKLLEEYKAYGMNDLACVYYQIDKFYGLVSEEVADKHIENEMRYRGIHSDIERNTEYLKILSSIPPSLRSEYNQNDTIAVYQFMDTYYYG